MLNAVTEIARPVVAVAELFVQSRSAIGGFPADCRLQLPDGVVSVIDRIGRQVKGIVG